MSRLIHGERMATLGEIETVALALGATPSHLAFLTAKEFRRIYGAKMERIAL